MKQLFENWRKLTTEGEVIQFPGNPTEDMPSDGTVQFVINLEDELSTRLAKLHGNISEIPIEKLERLDTIIDAIEDILSQ